VAIELTINSLSENDIANIPLWIKENNKKIKKIRKFEMNKTWDSNLR
jgi:hypothetical protein